MPAFTRIAEADPRACLRFERGFHEMICVIAPQHFLTSDTCVKSNTRTQAPFLSSQSTTLVSGTLSRYRSELSVAE